jgi:hypothetical protein
LELCEFFIERALGGHMELFILTLHTFLYLNKFGFLA